MNWNEAVGRLKQRVDYSRMPRRARATIDAAGHLYVACSGGADSVFALLYCYLYLKSNDAVGRLSVLHLNHRLRGEASDSDARYVAELCDSLGIPCQQGVAEWKKPPEAIREADARSARLRFFAEATGADAKNPAWIATGHHADDVVETVLMRLSRGSGLQGLSAPREISQASPCIQFLRPILNFERSEIRSILQACGIPWREDATNQSKANYRARLRRKVIPAWEDACDRNVAAGVCRSRRLLAEDWEALQESADRAWSRLASGKRPVLSRAELTLEPVAIQRRLLHRLVAQSAVASALTAPVVDSALRDLASGSDDRYEVSTGLWLVVGKESVKCERKRHRAFPEGWMQFSLPLGCIAYLPDGGAVRAERIVVSEDLLKAVRAGQNDNARQVYIRVDGKQTGAVGVRRRLPGDAFKPHGKPSAKKLKSLFIDYKIKVEERDNLPIVLAGDGEIVWVPGLPPHGDLLLSPDCKAALRLTYER